MESYIDSVKVERLSREARVSEAIDVIKELINTYAKFGKGTDSHMEVPVVNWDDSAEVSLEFFDDDGRDISRAHAERIGDNRSVTASATLSIYKGVPAKIATIDIARQDVLGPDDTQLNQSEIKGVIADLERYVSLLAAEEGS